MPGTVTSAVEVTRVSVHGFWLLIGDEETSAAFTDFPWLRKATIEQLTDVRRPTENHLCWSQLDIDLSVDSLSNPSAFALIFAG